MLRIIWAPARILQGGGPPKSRHCQNLNCFFLWMASLIQEKCTCNQSFLRKIYLLCNRYLGKLRFCPPKNTLSRTLMLSATFDNKTYDWQLCLSIILLLVVCRSIVISCHMKQIDNFQADLMIFHLCFLLGH